ncbi:hypothetical protein [Jiulongibacter sediminis]|jgi:hypothetical protein|uniref:Membrane protein n=1 Tax=Jiulongibacter sediminis TaxID=1605367 RepID=A0A0P7BZ72_9BACT|nr:hypothetical protein [Jiulongibacter sediminis]KPM49789.1 membrane protein [Jiulongibacter sediminis]TBX26827.1 membrane protein [Jiulongibacter sediminis]
MIKTTAIALLVLGVIGLVLGLPGVFGTNLVNISPWALSIGGLIFFLSGTSMLKTRRDTDEIHS